jgi:hypothetical protein
MKNHKRSYPAKKEILENPKGNFFFQFLAAGPILAGPILLDRYHGWAIDYLSQIFY